MRPRARTRHGRRLELAVLLSALLAPACSLVTTTYLDPRDFKPRKTEDVLVAEERPARPHVLIACLTAEAEGRTHSHEELVAELRRKAARLGGDVLVVYGDANTRLWVGAGVLVGAVPSTRQRHVMADVVVFADRPELSPAPPR